MAAIIVAIAALPLSMGYAIAAGLPPHIGIYCTVIPGFIVALLGGSKVQISGAAVGFETFVIMLMSNHGPNGLFTCLALAGVMVTLIGLTGLGNIVKFIPRPIVQGIASGIGAFLIIGQLKNLLGLNIPTWAKLNSFQKLFAVFQHIHTSFLPTALIGITSLVMLFVLQKHLKKIPGPMVVAVLFTALVAIAGINADTIGSKFKGIPHGFVLDAIPQFQTHLIPDLLGPALTLTMLITLKSLIAAAIGDRMIKAKHKPNIELVAQGLGNVASAFVGGMPSTGLVSRTANNARCGAQTPLAGIFVSLALLSVLFFAAPIAAYIPLCILATIMITVGYNMGEWSEVPKILKSTKADALVWSITFIFTTLGDLDSAIKLGFLAAALLYIQRIASTTKIIHQNHIDFQNDIQKDQFQKAPAGVGFLTIHGPFLFGATDQLTAVTDKLSELPDVLILRLNHMTAIDATGIQALEHFIEEAKKQNKHLILSEIRPQPEKQIKNAHIDQYIGELNLCQTLANAITRAKDITGGNLTENQTISLSEFELLPHRN